MLATSFICGDQNDDVAPRMKIAPEEKRAAQDHHAEKEPLAAVQPG